MYPENSKGIGWKYDLSDNSMQLHQSALSFIALQPICMCDESEENKKMSGTNRSLTYIFYFYWTQVQTCTEIVTDPEVKLRNFIYVKVIF